MNINKIRNEIDNIYRKSKVKQTGISIFYKVRLLTFYQTFILFQFVVHFLTLLVFTCWFFYPNVLISDKCLIYIFLISCIINKLCHNI